MSIVFFITAALTLVSAIAAMTLRNLIHCALCMVLAFAGIAATYLQLSAEFVGFAQVMVYVGAVAILIVFAVLLTRGTETGAGTRIASRSWMGGLIVAALVFGGLSFAILSSAKLGRNAVPTPQMTVKKIGDQLMTRYVLPLEVIGLLLTAAMIGAVIISMRVKESGAETGKDVRGHSENPNSARSRTSADLEIASAHTDR